MCDVPSKEDGTVTRSAEYVGCFPVDDRCLDEQIQQLHIQLKALRKCKRRRPVSLRFSFKGVKVYDEDETTLLMAHALRRISLSTARPSDSQFAFVSHNPGSPDTQLYCHLFQARHARAAQFLNLLLCRCFQLSYLDSHPEEAQDESTEGKKLTRVPSLLNQGFPLSVSALVSFRRAPFLGLFPGAKVKSKSSTPDQKQSKKEKDQQQHPQSQTQPQQQHRRPPSLHSSPDEEPVTSPMLTRKKAIRNKGMSSGAYRSFTCTPLKQRQLQERMNQAKGKEEPGSPARRARTPSLAESEEALAQAVWCWAGLSSDSSSALLAEDVLGAYLLCPHPKKPSRGTLIMRFPSGLATYAIKNTKGKYLLEGCHHGFESISTLIDYYTECRGELECQLNCARVNHCYEWEENVVAKPQSALPHYGLRRAVHKYGHGKSWV
ncbi:SH2 domain-containing protein 5 isoform X2 [Engraulis encrasicolus]|uniref:SH2 domain-containing protein 5 isoform X2 n=1 Tax=Engraulis encrasicolus TaxID=184585 RepID=UPI002FCFB3FB